jgi:sensor histidine kinase regulating citrate/malate metabolism
MLTCAFIYHYLYQRLYRKRIFIPCTKREWLFLFGYLLFITALFVLILLSEKNGAATFVVMTISVMLLTIIIPLFVFYNKIHNYYRERVEFQETYLQAELAHFQQYKRAQEETRRFRHDIRNNLLCLNEMLHDGRMDEATNYLQELLEGVQSLSSRYVSGDEVLDCILSAKTGEMQQKQITFHLNGVLAGGLPWKPIDICNVFANALDNAIEACDKLEDEKCTITMTLKATPQYWFVRIENPVAQDVDVSQIFQERGGYTSKPNAAQHGLGTYNIKRTVESYDGIVKAECKDQWFALELMIDKSCTA